MLPLRFCSVFAFLDSEAIIFSHAFSRSQHMPGSKLQQILTRQRVRELALSRSYIRGLAYLLSGAVSNRNLLGDTLTATVRGTENHTVRLSAKNDLLEHRCTCPYARDEGQFCKHCAATALAWLKSPKSFTSPPSPASHDSSASPNSPDSPASQTSRAPRAPRTPAPSAASAGASPAAATRHSSAAPPGNIVRMKDVRHWLLSQTPETLVPLLLEAADDNDRLRKRLLRLAAAAAGKTLDLAVYRATISLAIEVSDFVDWDEMSDYTDGIYDIATSLAELVTNNHAAAAKELAEYAFSLLNNSLFNKLNDQGELGMAMDELFKIHAKACRILKTSPTELAQRLHDLKTNDRYGHYYDIARHYTAALGAAGRRHLKTLAAQPLESNATNTAA